LEIGGRSEHQKSDFAAVPIERKDGKPDLSGIWQAEADPRGPGLFGLGESPSAKYFRDILSDFRPGEEPLTPEGREIIRQHGQPGVIGPNLKCLPDGVPHADLLPEPFKIIQTPGEILFLYEVETIFRQIFTDARICVSRSASTGAISGIWRSLRPLPIRKVFTKPVTINFVEQLLPDTDVFEHICYENEKTRRTNGQSG